MPKPRPNDAWLIEISSTELPDEVASQLYVAVDTLDSEMATQPVRYAQWANAATSAWADAEVKKLLLKRHEAAAYKRYREQLEGKKPTEAMMTAMVDGDDAVREAADSYLEAATRARLLAKIEVAFLQRHDALNSLMATERRLIEK